VRIISARQTIDVAATAIMKAVMALIIRRVRSSSRKLIVRRKSGTTRPRLVVNLGVLVHRLFKRGMELCHDGDHFLLFHARMGNEILVWFRKVRL
jgi:hypothetical protein